VYDRKKKNLVIVFKINILHSEGVICCLKIRCQYFGDIYFLAIFSDFQRSRNEEVEMIKRLAYHIDIGDWYMT
jgi:hypothetical protein